jgi:uncharacterized membrane protein
MTDKNVLHTMYLLHGLAPFTFWTLAIIPMIMGAMKRRDVQGTYLEAHISYLARTFWFGILWVVIVTVLFAITIVGLLVLWIPWTILTLWYLYRVIRGWLRLNDGQPI